MPQLLRTVTRELTAPDGTRHTVEMPVYENPTPEECWETVHMLDRNRAQLATAKRLMRKAPDYPLVAGNRDA